LESVELRYRGVVVFGGGHNGRAQHSMGE
jgi:hypothetical protein